MHPTLTISMQIWTNYETHIFKKWGGAYPQTPPWLHQCPQVGLEVLGRFSLNAPYSVERTV